jgi:heptaprenyl diphosphate synthase
VVLLGALCLFLSTLEYLIPKPLPFIRIGLANLPLMAALDLLSPRYFILLVLIKIAGAGIVGGTFFSHVFLFSLSGGIVSALVMYSLRRISPGPAGMAPSNHRLSLAGIGIAGSLCSSGIQLLLARFLILGGGVRYLIPPFLAVSLITGCALGLFCEQFCRHSRWYRGIIQAPDTESTASTRISHPLPLPQTPENPREQQRRLRRNRWDQRFNTSELAAAGFIALLLFLFNPSTLGRSLQFLFFWFCAWASGRKNNPLVTLSVIAGVTLVNLLVPYGRVLAAIGPLHITSGSLLDGLQKGITLEGLLMLSTTVIRSKPRPGTPALKTGSPTSAGPVHPGIFSPVIAFGHFLGESLSVFGVLRDGKGRIRPGHIIEDVDNLLLALNKTPVPTQTIESGNAPPSGQNNTHPPSGRLWLALGLLITAALTLLPGILNIA